MPGIGRKLGNGVTHRSEGKVEKSGGICLVKANAQSWSQNDGGKLVATLWLRHFAVAADWYGENDCGNGVKKT